MASELRSRGVDLRRICCLAAFVPAYAVATLLANSTVPLPFKIEVAIVLVTTTVAPAAGLLLITAVAPLGDMVTPLLGGRPIAHAETLVLAFLAAWLVAVAFEDEPAPSTPRLLRWSFLLFACVAISSTAATALQLSRARPDIFRQVLHELTDSYLLTGDPIGAHTAAGLLEGMGLALAVLWAVRRDPRTSARFLFLLVGAGIVGAIGSGLLAVDIAPLATRLRRLASELPRYSATIGDVNATASWYVLLIGICGGTAWACRGVARISSLVAIAVLIAAVGLTGSRAGIGTTAIMLAAAAVLWLRKRGSRRLKRLAVAGVAVVLLGGMAFFTTRSSRSSIDMRVGFTQASARMIAVRPVFGVGIGRYYALSELVLPPSLAWAYGRENAHDYYLQIAAEMGVVGLGAFALLVITVLAPTAGGLRRGEVSGRTVGVWAGVLAYLITAAGGQPFLVTETAIPFWLAVGLLAADRPGIEARPRKIGAMAGTACLLIACSIPFRPGVPRLRLSSGEDGFGPQQNDRSGIVYRSPGEYSSVFVGPGVTEVRIPLRHRGGQTRPGSSRAVAISVPGWATHSAVPGADWSTVDLTLPGASPLAPFQRINFWAPGDDPNLSTPHDYVDVGQIAVVTARW